MQVNVYVCKSTALSNEECTLLNVIKREAFLSQHGRRKDLYINVLVLAEA